MANATAILSSYNGYNGGWYGWKYNFYNDAGRGNDYCGLAHEWGGGANYCYCIAFKLPIGTYSAATLSMSNLGYAQPWQSTQTTRTCNWCITDTIPKSTTNKPQGTKLLSGTVTVSGLKLYWCSTSTDYVVYPSNYVTTSQGNFTVTDSNKYYYFYLQGGDSVRVGFWQPTISIAGYTAPTYAINYHKNGANGTAPSADTKVMGVTKKLAGKNGMSYDETTSVATKKVTLCPNYDGCTNSNYTVNKLRTYTLAGWHTDPDKWQEAGNIAPSFEFGADYTTDSAIDLYVHWQYSDSWESYTIPSSNRTGYILSGWSTTSAGSVAYAAGNTWTPTDSSSDLILYAKWTKINYTIKYYIDGICEKYETVGYDNSHTLYSPTVSRGHIISKWKDANNNEYSQGESVSNLSATNNAVINLYATTSPIEYSVTRWLDNVHTTVSKVSYGAAYNFTAPTKAGHIFVGWTTNSDGSAVGNQWTGGLSGTWTYIAGESGISNSNTITLYPIWKKTDIKIIYKVYDTEVISNPMNEDTYQDEISTVEDIFGDTVKPHHKLTGWFDTNGNLVDFDEWQMIIDRASETDEEGFSLYRAFAHVEPRYKILYINSSGIEKQLIACTKRSDGTVMKLYPYFVEE